MSDTDKEGGFSTRVAEAATALRDLFPETPLQLNAHLSKKYGARVFLKREDLSPVRSYKIRGAYTFSARRCRSGSRPRASSAPPPATMRKVSPSHAGNSARRA